MRFVITREALIKPLQLVAGVVERRQTLPVLSNILMVAEGDQLSLTGTDLEVELVGRVQLQEPAQPGSVTVPARKLMDICKSLSDDARIEMELSGQKMIIKSGRSKFSLTTLAASEFPNVEDSPQAFELSLPQSELRQLIEKTGFSMAQQDVRYYLNGMLLEVSEDSLRSVATDGHRLATSASAADVPAGGAHQIIVPRKGILELARLLQGGDSPVTLVIGASHIRANVGDYTFTSKLVDGKFPDYQRVIPKNGDKVVLGDRQELRQVFQRIAILSNEKYRGVRLTLSDGYLKVTANNPEQEEAEETVAVEYEGPSIDIGFNVNYLLDVLSILGSDVVRFTLADANSSALIQGFDDPNSTYVIMPMRM
ncbi:MULTISPECIES: DNA polymerase III subunit beta [unclassified Marinobacterium]|jgi:DNA polymerase III subunit beta|uniref:DNA polymerase III subunit beta n=1 Tax=unclassified Marinobacterium TaxID=2644139 RepID=UPI00156A2286|nr:MULTISPECIES: DNA polymerase III subunit beta [unclassified Marinobacterium]NRP11123.1 DNA polymerase III subunit beta [Marinobacterium sp. xm-g-48]NRP16682.1 DNA polymerase III subunit beta [Marinobacterium sp. xm-a-152]NRP28543.1 DNA polymerase III subunit beta [Marinobacterium sp. xm-d-420]NRP36658.1 DNA polymerase III subunit beta [Marinobacterium sp. xm-d-579]NRP38710.1 DNA polymerase III subunit beta [Marinobacterium sp. xm-a-121]